MRCKCECGETTGVACPAEAEILIEWMPPCWRSAHEAAGNRGIYPRNGALRLRVAGACAQRVKEEAADADWTEVLSEALGAI